MHIIYSLVARGSCVLAEYTNTSGNFTTVTRRILEKIPPQNDKRWYSYDGYVLESMLNDMSLITFKDTFSITLWMMG